MNDARGPSRIGCYVPVLTRCPTDALHRPDRRLRRLGTVTLGDGFIQRRPGVARQHDRRVILTIDGRAILPGGRPCGFGQSMPFLAMLHAPVFFWVSCLCRRIEFAALARHCELEEAVGGARRTEEWGRPGASWEPLRNRPSLLSAVFSCSPERKARSTRGLHSLGRRRRFLLYHVASLDILNRCPASGF